MVYFWKKNLKMIITNVLDYWICHKIHQWNALWRSYLKILILIMRCGNYRRILNTIKLFSSLNQIHITSSFYPYWMNGALDKEKVHACLWFHVPFIIKHQMCRPEQNKSRKFCDIWMNCILSSNRFDVKIGNLKFKVNVWAKANSME